MNIHRSRASKAALIAAGVAFLIQSAAPCTLAVISGKATAADCASSERARAKTPHARASDLAVPAF